MEVKHTHYDDKGENPEVHKEIETLNSMTPIWKKNKNELKDEDYNNFYKDKFMDFEDPIIHIHSKNEGIATYDALLYIPSRAPFDYYSKDYEKGLQLYSSGVMIMEKCSDLLPDYFSFVRGLVDSEDLSLNISREMLQHDRQLKIIAKNVEKSVKNELTKLMKTIEKNILSSMKHSAYSLNSESIRATVRQRIHYRNFLCSHHPLTETRLLLMNIFQE